MAKEEGILVEGVIIDARPNAMFGVKLNNDAIVLAHISGKIRTNQIRILPDDKVLVEVSPYDLTHGRIVRHFNEKR